MRRRRASRRGRGGSVQQCVADDPGPARVDRNPGSGRAHRCSRARMPPRAGCWRGLLPSASLNNRFHFKASHRIAHLVRVGTRHQQQSQRAGGHNKPHRPMHQGFATTCQQLLGAAQAPAAAGGQDDGDVRALAGSLRKPMHLQLRGDAQGDRFGSLPAQLQPYRRAQAWQQRLACGRRQYAEQIVTAAMGSQQSHEGNFDSRPGRAAPRDPFRNCGSSPAPHRRAGRTSTMRLAGEASSKASAWCASASQRARRSTSVVIQPRLRSSGNRIGVSGPAPNTSTAGGAGTVRSHVRGDACNSSGCSESSAIAVPALRLRQQTSPAVETESRKLPRPCRHACTSAGQPCRSASGSSARRRRPRQPSAEPPIRSSSSRVSMSIHSMRISATAERARFSISGSRQPPLNHPTCPSSAPNSAIAPAPT